MRSLYFTLFSLGISTISTQAERLYIGVQGHMADLEDAPIRVALDDFRTEMTLQTGVDVHIQALWGPCVDRLILDWLDRTRDGQRVMLGELADQESPLILDLLDAEGVKLLRGTVPMGEGLPLLARVINDRLTFAGSVKVIFAGKIGEAQKQLAEVWSGMDHIALVDFMTLDDGQVCVTRRVRASDQPDASKTVVLGPMSPDALNAIATGQVSALICIDPYVVVFGQLREVAAGEPLHGSVWRIVDADNVAMWQEKWRQWNEASVAFDK